MADVKIDVDYFSRMKETTLLQKDGRIFFGRWTPPTIKLDGDEEIIQVTVRDKGTLDFIAEKKYGTRDAAWAIGLVNKIYDIRAEIIPGLRLVLPSMKRIEEALQKEENE